MLNKNELMDIAELEKSKIELMDNNSLSAYTEVVDKFVEALPNQEENIKHALIEKDRTVLANSLEAIYVMLRQIYADKLAEVCSNYIETLDIVQDKSLRARIIAFLKDVAALSIDLQVLEYNADETGETQAVASGKPIQECDNTILAVDDARFFLTSMKTMLQGSGYKAVCFNSGMAALNYLKNHCPSLFILDIEMPEMDGYELAQKIKALGQAAPIIFLTGSTRKDAVIKAINAGAADFIIKPATKKQLLERIGKYVEPIMTEEDAEDIYEEDEGEIEE